MTHHALAALVLCATLAHAAEDWRAAAATDGPCDREILDEEEAFERNAWAVGCGYLPEAWLTWALLYDVWVAFSLPGAPMDCEFPCAGDWGEPVALCPAELD